MKVSRYFTFYFVLLSFTALCQQEATTADGKKVFLYPDGTWKPATVENIRISPVPISGLELPKPRSSDDVIRHTGYTLSYNQTYHIANWVAYKLLAQETNGIYERTNKFVPDPLLKSGSASNEDYKGSGYDRGHLAPAGDIGYSAQTMIESFYLSNMSPQNPSFNRGIWKRLEEQVRHWAVEDKAVYVVTGTVLSPGLSNIGYHQITVPRLFYKVILDYEEPDVKGIGFIMPNEGSKEPLQRYAVTIDSVEKITGNDFFYQLPDEQERIIESTVDLSKWSWTSTKTQSKKQGGGPSVQCQGKTKAGNRCKNKTTNLNGYCYQHQSQAGGVQTTPANVAPEKSSSRRTTSVRCSATTKKGIQCSHMTYSPNGLCWQHGGD